MNLKEQTYKIKSIMGILSESNQLQQLIDKKNDVISNWTDYYGSEEKATDEFNSYISDFNRKFNQGGFVYRIIFVNSIEELNLNDIGQHWTLETYYIDDFIDNLWMHYGKNKKIAAVIELYTEPNNITPASDVVGNPEEKEINLIDLAKTKINKLYQYQGKTFKEI
jgi:hypothetical protein